MTLAEIEYGSPVFIGILVILGIILIIILVREINCWYWKINDRIKKMEQISTDLDDIKTLLSENNERLKEFVDHFKNG